MFNIEFIGFNKKEREIIARWISSIKGEVRAHHINPNPRYFGNQISFHRGLSIEKREGEVNSFVRVTYLNKNDLIYVKFLLKEVKRRAAIALNPEYYKLDMGTNH